MSVTRFRISTHDNGYYCVSIPRYQGGEVVAASDYDYLAKRLAEVTRNLDEMISTVSRAVSQCEANATVMIPASRESVRRAREALNSTDEQRAKEA